MEESNTPVQMDINRRESVRSTRLSMQMPMQEEEEEDDYALAAMGMGGMGMSDGGYQPGMGGMGGGYQPGMGGMGISDGGYRPSDQGQEYRPPQTTQSPPVETRTPASPPPRPSSISKPKGPDSFALRNDGGMGPMASRGPMFASSGDGGARSSRSSSISTGSTMMVRAESPYRGPTAPSHQYDMYTQQESRLARTASIATTSTVPAPQERRSYNGPSGPTHPYGMYPQGTVPEDGDPIPVPQIPVGFPGLNNDYQRRLGPEGEEAADLIGPDGHTEQLPPYTKYPENALAQKSRPSVQVPTPVAAIPPIAPIDGAGGIGLATRDPEFASREDLNSPQSRQSTRSVMSDTSSQHVNAATMELSEKPQLKKWQIAAKRKLCGIIPVWVVVLMVIVFLLFGIILGTVFAILRPHPKSKHPKTTSNQSNPTVYATMTTTFDATPLHTVPAGLPTLPIGTYQMPITTPSTAQSSCVLNTAENSAWSCSLAMTPLQMTIMEIQGASDLMNNEIMINYGNDSLNFFPYGAQPPILTTPQILSLVNDSTYPQRGPAWFFQMPYNKVVVLPQDDLSANMKRDSHTASQFIGRKGVAQVGEQPWFCYWNGTLLETFIYVNETSSSAGSNSPTTTTMSVPTGTNTYSSNVPTSTTGSSSGSNQNPQFLNQYPREYKVVERRVPRGSATIPAYCVAHEIQGDGSATPLMNSTGQPITLYLNETEPTTVTPLSGRSIFSDLTERDDDDLDCGCIWLSS